VIHDLGQRAHFQLPIGARDAHDLARPFGPRDEFAQIVVGPIIGVEALGLRALGFFQHGVSFAKLFAVFCHAQERLSCLLTARPASPALSRRLSLCKTKRGEDRDALGARRHRALRRARGGRSDGPRR
jgi:hypothetical protein